MSKPEDGVNLVRCDGAGHGGVLTCPPGGLDGTLISLFHLRSWTTCFSLLIYSFSRIARGVASGFVGEGSEGSEGGRMGAAIFMMVIGLSGEDLYECSRSLDI